MVDGWKRFDVVHPVSIPFGINIQLSILAIIDRLALRSSHRKAVRTHIRFNVQVEISELQFGRNPFSAHARNGQQAEQNRSATVRANQLVDATNDLAFLHATRARSFLRRKAKRTCRTLQRIEIRVVVVPGTRTACVNRGTLQPALDMENRNRNERYPRGNSSKEICKTRKMFVLGIRRGM